MAYFEQLLFGNSCSKSLNLMNSGFSTALGIELRSPLAFEIVFFDSTPKRAIADAQKLGRSALVPSDLGKGCHDRAGLGLLQSVGLCLGDGPFGPGVLEAGTD